jgi:D-alanyl-D-alanine carboxypeptidase
MKRTYISLVTLVLVLLSACGNDEDEIKKIGGGLSDNQNNTYENGKKFEEESNQNSLLNIEIEQTFISMVNGQEVISNPENIVTIVNKEKTLPGTYSPTDLDIPNIPFTFEEIIDKRFLRIDAIEPVEQLFAAAEEDNIELFGVSGYRSYERQDLIFQYQVELMGLEEANRLVALPGQSEHQLGLALDVTSKSAELKLTEEFGETVEGKWLKENAYKFGFIIRYPLGKEGLTGYEYEPWHIRYVGTEVAEYLYKNDLVLEQLFIKK